MSIRTRTFWICAALAPAALAALPAPARAVRVAVIKSWSPAPDTLPVVEQLNDNWAAYGDVRVVVDLSLQSVESFTYEDLVDSGADVLWLSNTAGGEQHYTPAEIAAINQYVEEGRHLLGTYKVFRHAACDNYGLAWAFGLPAVTYNGGPLHAEQTFDLLEPGHPLLLNLPSPYSSGTEWDQAQAPADDGSWDDGDFGSAQLLARTADRRGVITLYETATHHATYISEFVEYYGETSDAQLLYNAITLDAAPTGECCGLDGICNVVEEAECATGAWSEGGTCNPNPCPQPGACCDEGGGCFVGFASECPTGIWVEGADCALDSDGDGVPDACDVCPGHDDSIDSDADSVPDGCDRCPGFDDAIDADGDGVPDACDVCSGFDDLIDTDTDGVPDGCDICEGFDDAADCDDDGTPDGCEDEPDCNENRLPDNCDVTGGTSEDCDGDGVPDECQPDTDQDGIIDECDDCVGDNALIGLPCDSEVDPDDCVTGIYDCSSGTLICTDDDEVDDQDTDGDGVYDCNDLCPGTPGGVVVKPDGCRPRGACCFMVGICWDAIPGDDCALIGGRFLGDGLACDGDADGDGVFGCADECPRDPDKAEPGQCGCGVPDTDTDDDGAADCIDQCPQDSDKTDPGVCGCGVPDNDADGDDVMDCEDDCPFDPAKVSPGICGCGVPDDDSDGDETPDCEDDCPFDPAKATPGLCGCGVPDDDSDGDETPDCNDACPFDADKVEPLVCGCGVPDVDSDGDETLDCQDACPFDPGKVDAGVCGCGVPDADADDDGVFDCNDLCPDTPGDLPVDENGCPEIGACCFRVGVCADGNITLEECFLVGGFYQGNGVTCASECVFPHNGDFDGSGHVDWIDFANWPGCMTGPAAGVDVDDCTAFDFDLNDTVDLRDVAGLHNGFTPPLAGGAP